MRPEDETPLLPRGLASAPKFLENSQDKFLANEDENAYVQLEVFGDPAPAVEWFRGENDLSDISKIKFWTDGSRSLVFMGVESCTKADEGTYKCVLTNRFGRREHRFKLFISRSLIKGPPKKREVPLYWSEVPRAKFIKQSSVSQVAFTAKLTVADQGAQWFFRDDECTQMEKYEVAKDGGAFTLIIKDPMPEDTGCYRCIVNNQRDLFCETYLDVQPPDPEYNFLKSLPTIQQGYVGRPLKLYCLCAEDAEVSWFKDETEINDDDDHFRAISSEGEHFLEIVSPNINDSAKYTCKIIKFAKEGEGETSCHVEITEFQHRFSKRLPQNMSLVERDDLLLQALTQETFATVKWFKDGQELTDDTKHNPRVRLLVREGLHCLCIGRCEVSDKGVYTARTNTEETSCTVHISEFQHRFKIGLTPVTSVLEDTKVMFDVEVEDEEADVRWFHNDIEFRSEDGRQARTLIMSQGRKRCLMIKKCTVDDAAKITAKTNLDTTSTDFIVKCHNSFSKRLIETAECSEHCKMEFFVHVKDKTAPVYFLLNKFPIDTNDGRFQQDDLGDGRHRLTITKVSKLDEGVLSCRAPTNRGEEMLECKCIFKVTEGESPPLIGKVEPVTCVAILHSYSDRMNSYIQKEACRLVIPYKIEGTRISDLDILVEKEGQEVQIGNDIQMKVRNDRVVIDIVNPQRTNSGIYKVIISNDQGSCEIDVPVKVLDIPSPPLSVSVQEVRKDSMLVQWEKPKDDGGTPIKHFLTEILDLTINNIWTTVAMSDTGDCTNQLLENLVQGHRYCVRVTAANKIGQSQPQEAAGEIFMKDPWDAPSPCGKATVIDWTPTFMDISWIGPNDDGGSPITKFIIEVKESSMREWREGNIIPIEEIEYDGEVYRGRCENLQEEYEYRFRVIAVNKAGYSKTGSASEPVKAIYKNISPFIKGDGLKDIMMKEGKMLRFDLLVGGEPVPTIEWFRDDIRITNDDTTSITVYTQSSSAYTLKNIVLSIPKAVEHIHAGVYKLRLKNESGVFESVANVDIDGPPEMKARKFAEKKAKEKEEKEKQEREKMEEDLKNLINRKLSDVKDNGKDEDRDSGLKIGEESDDLSAFESRYIDAMDEDEDFYEQDLEYENNKNMQKVYITLENPEEYDNKVEILEAKFEGMETSDSRSENNTNNTDDSSSGVSCTSNTKTCQEKKYESSDDTEMNLNHQIVNYNSERIPSIVEYPSDILMSNEMFENKDKEQSFAEPVTQNKSYNNGLGNGPNTANRLDNVNLEKAEQYILEDEENSLDMWDLEEDKFNLSFKQISISSEDKTVISEINDSYQVSIHKDSLENFQHAINVHEPPASLFNLEEHLLNLNYQLDMKLKATGFTRSETVSEKTFVDGDKCLLALLDQMNREDQDFKVWEREDYCFLRWYVTKQMETLKSKVEKLKFMESIEGDVQAYIDKMSVDGVHLDRAFIQAAATIFNKDIILISADNETDFEVIEGGLSSPLDKGKPFYLGHIKKSENNSDIFISVMPNQIDSARIPSILTGDLSHSETENIETKSEVALNINNNKDKEEIGMPNRPCRQWKRMDSYNGNATKELDHIIQDILNEDSMEKLNKSLHCCETESESENENSKNIKIDLQDDWENYEEGVSSNNDTDVQNVNIMCGTDVVEIDRDSENEEKDRLEESIEHEKQYVFSDGQDNSFTETTPHKSEDKTDFEEDTSCDGWIYDDETGYWIEETKAGDVLCNDTCREEIPIENEKMETELIEYTEFNIQNALQKGNVTIEEYGEIASGAGGSDASTEAKTNDIEDQWGRDLVEENEVDVVNHGEIEVSMERTDTVSASDQAYLCPMSESTHVCETQKNSDIFSEKGTCEHESDSQHMQPLIYVESENVEEKDESCDGWTYDPVSGYWIEDAGVCTDEKDNKDSMLESEEVSNSILFDTKEGTELKCIENKESEAVDLQINTANQHCEEIVDKCNEISQLSENREKETEANNTVCDPKQSIAEKLCEKLKDSEQTSFSNLSSEPLNTPIDRTTTPTNHTIRKEASPESSEIVPEGISERLQTLAKNELAEVSKYQPDKNIQSKENLGEEKKVVKRKIKIKVSVTEQDQVKQCENVQDCSPVALALNTTTQHNIQNTQQPISIPDITSCVSGEDKKEISETLESSENSVIETKKDNDLCTMKIKSKQNKMFISDNQNLDTNLGDNVTSCVNACESDPNIRVVQTADGQTTEIKMRPPLRKYSTKRTASYRWSGTEMLLVEGPPEDTNSSNTTAMNSNHEILCDKNVSYEKANFKLEERLSNLGFIRSPTAVEVDTDGDNCLKALIDQMSQPGQDFNVWDKSDFCFLRWYIAKQLEIQISAGAADKCVKFSTDSPQQFVSRIQKDGEFTDNDYLYSVAKLFNKDIIVIESSNPTEEVTYIKGGPDDTHGKGKPIFLGHLNKDDAGNDFYQSIIPNENVHIEQIISSLQENL